MDNKTLFQDIQTKLEDYLYDYKNSYPKNYWQVICVDIPLITLIVSALVIIELLGVGVVSLTLIIALTLPYIYLRSSDSSGKWQELIDKRKNHEVENKELIKIIKKIYRIANEQLQNYPDVKNYLANYRHELEDEINRKVVIKNKYTITMMLGMLLMMVFIYFTIKTDTKLWFLNEKSNVIIEEVDINEPTHIADIKSLNGDAEKLKIFYIKASRPFLRIATPEITKTSSEDSCFLRIIITDQTGQAANGLPYFDFSYHFNKGNPKFIDSQPITSEYENHPYEIVRRVRYLQDNADDLRYTIEIL